MKISNIAKVVCAVACLSVSNVANAQVRELATGDWFTITESRQADVTLDGQTFEVYDIIASVKAGSTGNIHTFDQIQFSNVNQVWARGFADVPTPDSSLGGAGGAMAGYDAVDSHFLHTIGDFSANRGGSSETNPGDNPFSLNTMPGAAPLIHGIGTLDFYAEDGRFFGLSQAARGDNYPLARLVKPVGGETIVGSFGVIGDVNGSTTPLDVFANLQIAPGGTTMDKPFADVLNDNGYTSMAAAAAALLPQLEQGGPYTLFAPTNSAFEAAMANGLELTDEVVMHHVVEGEFDAATLQSMADAGESLTALSGRALNLSSGSIIIKPAYFLGGSTVVEGDLAAINGVVHGIDTVIPEPASGLFALLAGLAAFAGFRKRS